MRVPALPSLRRATAALLIATLAAGCVDDEGETDSLETDTPAAVDPIASGMEIYQTSCASCHGPEGKGNGPVADALTTIPADLTTIRARSDGKFPEDSVYAYIDGRQYVQAHGTREMPVWGNIWREIDGDPVRREEVDRRIRELVEYIRSIQTETAQGA